MPKLIPLTIPQHQELAVQIRSLLSQIDKVDSLLANGGHAQVRRRLRMARRNIYLDMQKIAMDFCHRYKGNPLAKWPLGVYEGVGEQDAEGPEAAQ
jgi:hypothetical protein